MRRRRLTVTQGLRHCRHNKRVPVFVALDRIRRQGWERTAALGAMRKIWTPDATWQAFIERTLAE